MSETHRQAAELFRADAKRLADFGQHEYALALVEMAEYCETQSQKVEKKA
jgi:hypothetical protein